jgi:hypothetical protein
MVVISEPSLIFLPCYLHPTLLISKMVYPKSILKLDPLWKIILKKSLSLSLPLQNLFHAFFLKNLVDPPK